MDDRVIAEIKKFCEALEKGGYNTRPSKLRQGCISFVSDHELTEEELDELWMQTFGHT
jgi:hypothetical protein